jgi:hypothetical protein
VIPPPPDAPPAVSAPKPGLSRGLRTTITAVVMVAVILIGIIGYAVIGFGYTATRVASADRTLNAVVSHQNSLNSTFHDIDTKFNALNSGSSFNAQQARSVVDQFVTSAKSAGKTVDSDDASLVVAARGLNDQSWLTALSRSSLDRESKRIVHARKALANAKTVTQDYALDGQFLEAFLDATIDLDALATATGNADIAGAKTTLANMQTHVDKALQLSTAPGLPPDMHDLMVDFQKLVSDFGKFLAAAEANDEAGVTAYDQSVTDDAKKIGGYQFDTMTAAIVAFYKPYVDGFNSEMAAATS